MIALSCNNITKSFGIDVILQDISFTINEGDKIGIIGRNGAGKSTLFKILTNQIPYDSGEIYTSKNTNVGYLKQNLDFNEKNTLYDECIKVFQYLIDMENEIRLLELDISKATDHEGKEFDRIMAQYSLLLEEFKTLNGYGYRSEVRGVLKGMGFSQDEFEKEIFKLSGGQKSRLNVAKLLLTKPNILLLDEPTNHLDIEATTWLEGFLRNYPGTLMIISHDRYFLDQITNKIFELENKGLLQYEGNYSGFVKYKADLYVQQMKKYLEQQKEKEKQEEMIRRFKGHGTEKLAKRAQSREKLLEKMETIDKPIVIDKKTRIKFKTQIKSGRDVLKVDNLSKSFDGIPLFFNVGFSIFKSEKASLIGPNGIGKTTLFKILLDELPYSNGEIKLGHNVFLGYYDQEQSNLKEDRDLIEEICDAHPKISIPEARSYLGSFLFHGDDVFKKVSDLSGGEKSRLSLLKLMLSNANFLLLDEPTNHLDLDSKEILEDALLDYDGTILVISHDRYLLNKITNKTLDLTKDGVSEYLGNYDYYYEKKNELMTPKPEIDSDEKTKTQVKDEKKKKKIEDKQKKEHKLLVSKLEEEMHKLESKLNELDLLMCKEEIYSNPEKSKSIYEENEITKIKLNNLYEEWVKNIEIL